MNIKITLVFMLCILCFNLNAQVEINPQDSTAKIIPVFKKGQKLTYQIDNISHTPEEKDTTNYRLNFKFDKTDDDFANFTIYYTDTETSNLPLQLLNNVKNKIRLDVANGEFVITNEADVKKRIIKNIKKMKRKHSNNVEVMELLTSLDKKLHSESFSAKSIYSTSIKAIFGFYKKTIPYNRYHTDTLSVNDPMGNPTKEVQKYGIFKEGNNYKLLQSGELLNDGIRKSMRKQTEMIIREQFKDSLTSQGQNMDDIEITIEETDINVEIKKEISVVYNKETGIVNEFSLVDQKNIFDLKLFTKRTYKLLE